MICDTMTKTVVDRIGHDTPVKWKEVTSGIIFTATQYEVLDALFDANKVLQFPGFISLEDFLSNFDESVIEIPNRFDPNILGSGWSQMCYSCWDGVCIDICFKAKEIDGQTMFCFYFEIPYCRDCYDCDGCDPLSRAEDITVTSQKYQSL